MSETSQLQQPAQNKMGTMPINRLLISMSLPIVASMLVQAMYNIIDSIFVAQISEEALAAVSMAFPIQNLMIAVAVGTCVGVNALLSRSLGEQKAEDARLAAVNGIFLSALNSLCFVLFGIFGSEAYFSSQTTDPVIIEYGIQYLQIVTVFSFGIFGSIVLERILQSTGRSIYNMYSQGLGAITNIILDPILMFGLFGLPAMGIRGAAVATILGQILSLFLSLYFNLTKNHDVNISMRGFKPHGRTIRIIYEVGIPSIIMQSIGSVMTYGMNMIMISFSTTAVTVLGIYFKLQSFVYMPVFGLNNGMVPIIAYNYGARSKKRITDTIKFSVVIAMTIVLTGFVLFQLLPEKLLMIFNASEHLLEIGVPALRTISLSFLFAGYCIVVSSVFQAMGNGMYSLIISIARQLVCILPLAYMFARLWGLRAVWFAFPLSECMSLLLCTLLLKRIYNQKIKDLEN